MTIFDVASEELWFCRVEAGLDHDEQHQDRIEEAHHDSPGTLIC